MRLPLNPLVKILQASFTLGIKPKSRRSGFCIFEWVKRSVITKDRQNKYINFPLLEPPCSYLNYITFSLLKTLSRLEIKEIVQQGRVLRLPCQVSDVEICYYSVFYF